MDPRAFWRGLGRGLNGSMGVFLDKGDFWAINKGQEIQTRRQDYRLLKTIYNRQIS